MQEDGDFIIYKNSTNTPIWATHTKEPYKGEYFIFQTNGNLEVFSQYELIWSSNTKHENAHKLIM